MEVWVVCIVYVGSCSFGVGIVLRLSCLISDFVRKVLKFFKSFLNRMDRLGSRTIRFIRFGLLEWQFGEFALFVLVLGHSESELHSVCLFGFLTF